MSWKLILKKEEFEQVNKSPTAMFNRLPENLKQEVRDLMKTGMNLNDAVLRVASKLRSQPPKTVPKPKPVPQTTKPSTFLDRRSRR